MTQMIAQIYRQRLLNKPPIDPEGRWVPPYKQRLPFRIELRNFGEWLSDNAQGSVDQYLAVMSVEDSGGSTITVDDVHSIVENSPLLLIFDGLDEVGSDELRDEIFNKIRFNLDWRPRYRTLYEDKMGLDWQSIYPAKA